MRRRIQILTIILTASLGRIAYNGHVETYYNLPMQRVIDRAHDCGINGETWTRDDGCKMLGDFVMVAGHESIPLGTVVETSRGQGIVVDRHATGDVELYDLAVEW